MGSGAWDTRFWAEWSQRALTLFLASVRVGSSLNTPPENSTREPKSALFPKASIGKWGKGP